MNLPPMATEIIIISLFSLTFLLLICKIAKIIGLVDKPNNRKHHQGLIPLVGGISVYASICFAFLVTDKYVTHATWYLTCAGLLVLIGTLDDRFDISVKVRVFIQAVVGVVMMVSTGLYLDSFGHILGPRELVLGPIGYPVTLFAVWAAINAFNMVDGIDGLLGGLSCVSFSAMSILFYQSGHTKLMLWCLVMIAAITPCVLLNMGLLGKRYKVFMGDAGSTLIGFTIIWLLLEGTQGDNPAISPVTALWIIAIPLVDMMAIVYRRLRAARNPFSPDRQHIHHLLMRSGFSPRQAFISITLAAALLAAIGITGECLTFVPEWAMLALFLPIFSLYSYCIKHSWRVARFIKRTKRLIRRTTRDKCVGDFR